MRATCADCHQEFDPTTQGTWTQVVGWTVNRKGGGANTVREKRETGQVRCPPCGKERDLKIDRQQGSLGL